MKGRSEEQLDRLHRDDKVQGTRLFVAILILICMVVAAGLTVGAIYSYLVYLVYGFKPVWSGKPPELVAHPNLIYLLAGLLISFLGLVALLWYRLFSRSGYLSRHTLNELNKGRWPVVGGYWKPFGYAVFIVASIYGARLGYEQLGFWLGSLPVLAFLLIFLYSAWRDLREFLKNRHKNKRHDTAP